MNDDSRASIATAVYVASPEGDTGKSTIALGILHRLAATVPRVADGARLAVDDLGYRDDGIIHVTATYGYMDRPDVPAALAQLNSAQTEGPLDLAGATYFLSKVDLVMGKER